MSDDSWMDALYLLHLRYGQPVFSHETALFFHDLTDREPFPYSATVKRGYNTSGLKGEGVSVYTVKKELHGIGIISMKTSFGHSVPVYDMERTICDLIRSRNHIDKHNALCMKTVSRLEKTKELSYYLCPERKISFDSFVNYEGRRFGVPFWYTGKTCRVGRDGYILYIYASDMSKVLTTHNVTWSRRDSFCKDQYTSEQPEEQPTMPARVHMEQRDIREHESGFERFNFEKEDLWNE